MAENIKTIFNWSSIVLLTISSIVFISCDDNNDTELINPQYKLLEVSCGSDFEIPVLTNNWSIEYVKDMVTGQNISDKYGHPLALDGNGKIESSEGWLTVARNSKNNFIVTLKENFDKSHQRKLQICINDAGKRDYVTIIQQAGTEYRLVQSEYEEIEEQRSIYVSDKECTSIVLNNPSSTEVWESTGTVYKNVMETSTFTSDDYGAFDWISEEEVNIAVPDLLINDTIRWENKCVYKEGITAIPYINDISNDNKILMPPYSTLYLSGEITYCKRVCNYTFTIQNMSSGTQFEEKGIWTQIVPISSLIIGSEKNPQLDEFIALNL